MRVLLDTQAFIWWLENSPRLSAAATGVIASDDVSLYLSAASGWEMAIKTKLGTLRIADEASRFVPRQMTINGVMPLSIHIEHALRAGELPLHHRDPFDRMLVAQAQIERLPIITDDPLIRQYDVEVIW